MGKQVILMLKITPITWIRKICHHCGQILLIHDDTVWSGNKTYHYACWMKRNVRKSRDNP